MFARVTAYHADEDSQKLMQAFQETIGPLQVVEGFSHAYFLVDPETGRAVSMTIWESEAAMAASEPGGAERRQRRSEISGASVDAIDHFEVGLIAVAPGVEPAGRRRETIEEPGEELV
jgi:heme-degrading monooxygenase HmoA